MLCSTSHHLCTQSSVPKVSVSILGWRSVIQQNDGGQVDAEPTLYIINKISLDANKDWICTYLFVSPSQTGSKKH